MPIRKNQKSRKEEENKKETNGPMRYHTKRKETNKEENFFERDQRKKKYLGEIDQGYKP